MYSLLFKHSSYFFKSKNVFIVYLVLAFLTFGLTLFNPLLFDDAIFIQANQWLTWQSIPHFFRSFIPDSNWGFVGYRPLVMTSLVIEKELFNGAPWVLRSTNILFHIINSYLIFLISQKILKTKNLTWAFLVGLIFLLHPVQTNVINLVWKRSDLLFGFGLLLSLFLFQIWVESSAKSIKYLIGAYIAVLSTLLSKESGLILPGVVLLTDVLIWSNQKTLKQRLIFIHIPVLLFTSGLAWIVFIEQSVVLNSTGFQSQSFMPPSMALDRWTYLKTQAVSWIEYLKLSVWPIELKIFHHILPVRVLSDLRFLLGIGTIGVWLGLSVWFIKSRNFLMAFAMLWFVLLLLPSSSLIPLQLLFDEDRLYLSLFGFSLLMVLSLKTFINFTQNRIRAQLVLSLKIFPFLICFLFLIQDMAHARVWKNAVSLWSQNVKDEPNDPRAWVNLGQALSHAHRDSEAVFALQQGLKLEADYGVAPFFLADHFMNKNNRDYALKNFFHALRLNTFPSTCFQRMGVIHVLNKDFVRAARHFLLSIHRDQKNLFAFQNLATLLEENNESEAAIRVLRTAMILEPKNPSTLFHLAKLLWMYRHDRKGAKLFLREVLENRSEHGQAKVLWGKISQP